MSRREKRRRREYRGPSRPAPQLRVYRPSPSGFKSLGQMPWRYRRKKWSWSAGMFPNAIRTKLVYVTNGDDTTAGGTGYLYFRGNSVYDPDYAVGGGQPQFYDQLAVLYQRYFVHASQIDVHLTTTDDVPYTCVLVGANNATALTTPQFCEFSGAVVRHLGHLDNTSTRMTLSTSAKRMLQLMNPQDNPNASSATNTDPALFWLWWVQYTNTDGGNCAIHYTVRITYDVEFYELKNVVDA